MANFNGRLVNSRLIRAAQDAPLLPDKDDKDKEIDAETIAQTAAIEQRRPTLALTGRAGEKRGRLNIEP